MKKLYYYIIYTILWLIPPTALMLLGTLFLEVPAAISPIKFIGGALCIFYSYPMMVIMDKIAEDFRKNKLQIENDPNE